MRARFARRYAPLALGGAWRPIPPKLAALSLSNKIMPLRATAAVFLLAVCATAADGPPPAEIRKSAESLTKSLEVQSRLPNDSGVSETLADRQREQWSPFGSEGFSIPAPAAVLQLMQWALIVVAAIAIIAIIAMVLREPLQSRFQPISPPIGLAPDEPPPADPLTSWELLRGAPLARPQFQALRDLVLRVERAWFGQRPAVLEDYREVRANFDQFAAGAEGSAA